MTIFSHPLPEIIFLRAFRHYESKRSVHKDKQFGKKLHMDWYINNPIVNIDGLAKALCTNKHTLRKRWRSLPHFFVGQGTDLRSARFDVNDVCTYLKQRGENYDGLEGQQKRLLGGQVPTSEATAQKGGVQDKTRRTALGSRGKTKGVCHTTERDPFHLLSGIGD